LKSQISQIIFNILRIGTTVSQLKGILRICYKNYYENYQQGFERAISPNSQKRFLQGFENSDSFYQSLKEIYGNIILRVLKE
jgi:hypothetical protein